VSDHEEDAGREATGDRLRVEDEESEHDRDEEEEKDSLKAECVHQASLTCLVLTRRFRATT
jgi:hypothetical protein